MGEGKLLKAGAVSERMVGGGSSVPVVERMGRQVRNIFFF
jgi:hypothetical protein